VAANNLDEYNYASKVAKLLIACQLRFSELENNADNIVLITIPFNFPEKKLTRTVWR